MRNSALRPASRNLLVLFTFFGLPFALAAQGPSTPSVGAELPLVRIALFSSGVGYFEHRGPVEGNAGVSITFKTDEVNDALKSLVVRDGDGSSSPTVQYPSRQDSERALRAFRVDLSGNPSLADLLARMRGARIAVSVLSPPDAETGIRPAYPAAGKGLVEEGRILAMEDRDEDGYSPAGTYLTLVTERGIISLALDSLESVRFTDPGLQGEFDRAVDLLDEERDRTRTSLELNLPGKGKRNSSIGYVVAAPVWKASYRLDLSGKTPFLQAWAIVDNATERDWKGVELSLISGRPISFIQDLYAAVHLSRPVVPLAIAGSAAPRSYAAGVEADEYPEAEPDSYMMMKESAASMSAPSPAPSVSSQSMRKAAVPSGGSAASSLANVSIETAGARSAGDQFEFTFGLPVDLTRGRSALLPLAAGAVEAERVSIYTAGSQYAVLGARLKNTMGIKFPAGPVTVFDEGVYSGDALVDFMNEREERYLAYGEDLALTIVEDASSRQETTAVTLIKGIMTFVRRVSRIKMYTFRNNGTKDKNIIVEHPETSGAELFKPSTYLERADGRYRFSLPLAAGKQATLEVVERSPVRETITLSSLRLDAFVRYSTSTEVPQKVRDALSAALDLGKKADDASRAYKEIQTTRTELISDQARVRENLSSLGRESAEGKKYIARLLDLDSQLDKLVVRIEELRKMVVDTQAAYEKYVAGLTLE